MTISLSIGAGMRFLVTAQGNTVEEIARAGEPQIVLAGDLHSTEMAEPTAARFGRTPRDRETLYATTAGGSEAPVYGDERAGAQWVAVDTGELWGS